MAFMRKAAFALAIIVVLLTTTSHVRADYVIIKAPPSVQIDQKSSESLPFSDIPLISLASFGYSPNPEMLWTGLYQVNPFHTVKANILFSVVSYPGSKFEETLTSGLVSPGAVRVATVQDVDEIDTDQIKETLAAFPESSIYLETRGLANGNLKVLTGGSEGLFDDLSTSTFPAHFKDDLRNLAAKGNADLAVELGALLNVLHKLQKERRNSGSGTQDFYHFRFEGLAKTAAKFGLKSEEFQLGLQQTQHYIKQAAHEFSSIYAGNAVVQLVTTVETGFESSPSVHSTDGATNHQRRRQLLESTTMLNGTQTLNLAPTFSWLYPEMFNIILWFTVVFALTVFGVSWCMWFIDPGYDSVIYRLTAAPRMKSD